jgi:CheY-like chemotaxis protein
MARHLILVVCSDEQRRAAWHAAVRRLGRWVVPAPTLNRALAVRNTVRPALVFTDADLADGRAVALIQAMRAVPALEQVPVVVLGRVAPDEGHDLAGGPYVHRPQVSDHDAIGGLLEQLLAA